MLVVSIRRHSLSMGHPSAMLVDLTHGRARAPTPTPTPTPNPPARRQLPHIHERQVLDADGSGGLSSQEFCAAIKKLVGEVQ